MSKMLGIVKWIIRESTNPENKYPTTKTMVNDLITPKDACLYLDTMHYSNSLNIHCCVKTFKHHLQNDTWSYYTLHLLMDIYDIQSLVGHTKYYMNESVLNFLMPNVYRLFLNITIQHVHHHFNNGLSSTFLEFERHIDNIFEEINAYIQQFTTRSEMPINHEKCWIFGAAFLVVSGLVTTYRIYKSYTFAKICSRITCILLLYCTSVNSYYSMNVMKSFILNNMLYMAISLTLKHHRAPIMSLCVLFLYHLSTNMSDRKNFSSFTPNFKSATHTYCFVMVCLPLILNSNFDGQVVRYDHMYVQTEPMILFRRTDKNCYINIIEHSPAKTITSTCTFLYYHKISLHATLVTTSHFFYLLNIHD